MRRIALVAVVAVVLAGCAWARPRFDGARTGHNPIEVSISRENVSTLTDAFRASTSGVDAPQRFAVARGHLYVEGAPTKVFDSDGGDGCSGSPRVCQPQWTIGDNGVPDVIDPTLYFGQAAYDATGVQGCSGTPKTCDALWVDQRHGTPTGTVDPAQLHFLVGGSSAHGGELVELNGFPSPKPASCTAPAGQLPFCDAVWTRPLGGGSPGGVVGLPAVADGRVFSSYSAVGAPSGTLFAFDGHAATGSALWSAVLPGVGSQNIAVAEGVVLTTVQTTAGPELVAYDAAGVKSCSGSPRVCTPMWVSDPWTSAGFDAAPAIADGVVYRAVGNQLRAYDLHGVQGCAGSPVVCQKLWVAQVGPNVTAPAVANKVVYVSASDGTLQAYDADGITGCSATTRVCAPLWDTNVGSAAGPVAVSAGRVYVTTLTGTVRAFALP